MAADARSAASVSKRERVMGKVNPLARGCVALLVIAAGTVGLRRLADGGDARGRAAASHNHRESLPFAAPGLPRTRGDPAHVEASTQPATQGRRRRHAPSPPPMPPSPLSMMSRHTRLWLRRHIPLPPPAPPSPPRTPPLPPPPSSPPLQPWRSISDLFAGRHPDDAASEPVRMGGGLSDSAPGALSRNPLGAAALSSGRWAGLHYISAADKVDPSGGGAASEEEAEKTPSVEADVPDYTSAAVGLVADFSGVTPTLEPAIESAAAKPAAKPAASPSP
ncbi:hypothetical protein T492DRAFT_859970 [Pavlovales sp. CCMP2436]|nr:hypothetical protein T492DRAFT_859970 [Pavlovales sp. CCMP2436]